MENKLIKLPTPYGEMEILWDESLYQGFVPEQHGGTLIYNREKYFTTVKSITEFKSITAPEKVVNMDVNLHIEGGDRYIREFGDHLMYCHKNQTPVCIGDKSHFVVERIVYNTSGVSSLDIKGFLV